MIDVGGESTRPGAAPVTVGGRDRAGRAGDRGARPPATRRADLGRHRKPEVARAALAAGAALVNDVSAARDPRMLAVVAGHGGGDRADAHARRAADDAARHRATPTSSPRCTRSSPSGPPPRSRRGSRADRVPCSTPGSASARTPPATSRLLAAVADLAALGHPVVVGASRKSFIGGADRRRGGDRLPGSLAAIAGTVRTAAGAAAGARRGGHGAVRHRAAARAERGMSSVFAALRELTQIEVGVRDLVDILLVAIVFYMMLRGSRAPARCRCCGASWCSPAPSWRRARST